ncbi:MAG: ABC transporter substrate-binding protein [Pseudomonadota bacterium]
MVRTLMTSLAALAVSSAALAEDIKIGMSVTLSGPAGAIGQQVVDGFNLALSEKGGALGGVSTEVIVVDNELTPDVALTKVTGLLERDNVDIVVGTVFSNMLQTIFKPVIQSETFLISPNAGPSTFAGRNCNPYFFVTSYQNDQNSEALGAYATKAGLEKVFLMAPNYQAGRDNFEGFKRTFEGTIVDEVFVPLGHTDFSAEIARLAEADADALYTFMPGGMGVRFVTQFAQAGLKDTLTFLSAFTVDETTLPAVKDNGLGLNGVANWSPTTDIAASKAFVDSFVATYGKVPGGYAMQGYDTAMLIDSALTKVGGDMSDPDAFRDALRAAEFDSLRGDFSFNSNHYPVQDFYLLNMMQREDGLWQTAIAEKILDDHADAYAEDCRMR